MTVCLTLTTRPLRSGFIIFAGRRAFILKISIRILAGFFQTYIRNLADLFQTPVGNFAMLSRVLDNRRCPAAPFPQLLDRFFTPVIKVAPHCIEHEHRWLGQRRLLAVEVVVQHCITKFGGLDIRQHISHAVTPGALHMGEVWLNASVHNGHTLLNSPATTTGAQPAPQVLDQIEDGRVRGIADVDISRTPARATPVGERFRGNAECTGGLLA